MNNDVEAAFCKIIDQCKKTAEIKQCLYIDGNQCYHVAFLKLV